MASASDQRVFIPHSLADFHSILKRRPDCLVWAGGTFIGTSSLSLLESRTRDLISLQHIEELKRIYRTERFLDLGATVTLARMLKLDEEVLPSGLRQAILSTVPAPTRSLASIGGNLCVPQELLNLLPWMAAVDARLEIRKAGGVRFVVASRFLNEFGQPDLEPGEILYRIRIPVGRWNHQVYRRVPDPSDGWSRGLAIAAFADVHRDIVEDLRISYCFSNRYFRQFTLADAELVGRRLPLNERDIEDYCETVIKALSQEDEDIDPLLVYRIQNMGSAFLRKLPQGRE